MPCSGSDLHREKERRGQVTGIRGHTGNGELKNKRVAVVTVNGLAEGSDGLLAGLSVLCWDLCSARCMTG
jgi:hypothetical protein